MRLARHAVVGVLSVVLMVAGVSAHDSPQYKNTTTATILTATCSGTTTFHPENPVVTSTVTSYITVTLEPSQVYHPTWTNPLPFCETVTLAPAPPPSATRASSTVAVTTSTVIATNKQAVTVIVTPSPPNFSPTPKPPAPIESPPPPTESPKPPIEPPPVKPSLTFKPVVVTFGGGPITLPSIVSETTVVISGVTITMNPTEAIASGTTIEIPVPATPNPPPSFTGGAKGLRRGSGAGEAGAWAALAVGLLVM
ncbi:MAG: hypothetical protein M1840_001946 [Geoglossum simile]|nr:MAG: hypothetical protein M1840_001946 [Geoglossum simile]